MQGRTSLNVISIKYLQTGYEWFIEFLYQTRCTDCILYNSTFIIIIFLRRSFKSFFGVSFRYEESNYNVLLKKHTKYTAFKC